MQCKTTNRYLAIFRPRKSTSSRFEVNNGGVDSDLRHFPSRNKHYRTEKPKYPCTTRLATEEEKIEYNQLIIKGLTKLVVNETWRYPSDDPRKSASDILKQIKHQGNNGQPPQL